MKNVQLLRFPEHFAHLCLDRLPVDLHGGLAVERALDVQVASGVAQDVEALARFSAAANIAADMFAFLVTKSMSAPADATRTHSTWPSFAASRRHVRPYPFCVSVDAPPTVRSTSRTEAWPLAAASTATHRPFPKPRPRSAPRSSNKRSVVSCPACAARCAAVRTSRPRWRASTRVQLAARAHAAPVGRVEQVTQSRDVALRRGAHDALAAPGSSRAVERASRGRRPATGAPASRGRESRTRRSRGGRRASRPGRRMRVRHRRTRVPFCFGRHDSGVEDGTLPKKKSKHATSAWGRMSRDDTTRPTRKRAVLELYYTRYSQYLSHHLRHFHDASAPRSLPSARAVDDLQLRGELPVLPGAPDASAASGSRLAPSRAGRARRGLRARLPASGGRAGSSGSRAAARWQRSSASIPRLGPSLRHLVHDIEAGQFVTGKTRRLETSCLRGPREGEGGRRPSFPSVCSAEGHAIAAASSPSGITARTIASLSRPPAPRIHATFRSRSCMSRRDASSASSISDSMRRRAFLLPRLVFRAARAPARRDAEERHHNEKAKPDDAPPRAQR